MHLIVDGLCRVIALRASKTWAIAPLVLVLWSYLRRLARRFERLLARIDSGRAAPRPSPSRPERADTRPKSRLPAAFAWLCWMAPEAAALGTQLQALLAEPELAARLAAVPQAGRLLRQLLHMLGQPAENLPAAPPRSPPRSLPRSPPLPSPRRTASADASCIVVPSGPHPKPA